MPIELGAYTYGSPILRGNHNKVIVGKYTSFGQGCIFDCGFNHNHKAISTYPFNPNMSGCGHLALNLHIKGDIKVGNDVWFGEDCVIMSGVTIGDGAVIGMRTIVTKDILPYEIVVGAPMKSKGFRFTVEQIEKLLTIAWWNWPDEKVRDNAHLLLSENIDKFIDEHYPKI